MTRTNGFGVEQRHDGLAGGVTTASRSPELIGSRSGTRTASSSALGLRARPDRERGAGAREHLVHAAAAVHRRSCSSHVLMVPSSSTGPAPPRSAVRRSCLRPAPPQRISPAPVRSGQDSSDPVGRAPYWRVLQVANAIPLHPNRGPANARPQRWDGELHGRAGREPPVPRSWSQAAPMLQPDSCLGLSGTPRAARGTSGSCGRAADGGRHVPVEQGAAGA